MFSTLIILDENEMAAFFLTEKEYILALFLKLKYSNKY